MLSSVNQSGNMIDMRSLKLFCLGIKHTLPLALVKFLGSVKISTYPESTLQWVKDVLKAAGSIRMEMVRSMGDPYHLDLLEFDEAKPLMVQRTAAEQTKKFCIVLKGLISEQVESVDFDSVEEIKILGSDIGLIFTKFDHG